MHEGCKDGTETPRAEGQTGVRQIDDTRERRWTPAFGLGFRLPSGEWRMWELRESERDEIKVKGKNRPRWHSGWMILSDGLSN